MQHLSDEKKALWVANQQRPMTSEGFVEVAYKIADPTLAANTVYCTKLDWAQALEITQNPDKNVVPYGTLEPNRWRLNGSKRTLPDTTPSNAGYISQAFCDDTGVFTDQPVITLRLNKSVDTLAGLTITWDEADGEYATAFDIIPYSGSTARKTVPIAENTEVKSVVRFEMDNSLLDNFDSLQIVVKAWSRPLRRARIAKIFLGIHKVYAKRDLLSFSCSAAIDPLSATLPKYELQFEVDNRDGAFSPTNPKGLTQYMMERQELETRYGYRLGEDIEWIPGGVYYLSEWNAPENGLSASFSARDLLGLMDAIYYKGVYAKDGVSLTKLALDVLAEANLPAMPDGTSRWSLDSRLQGIKTVAPLPKCSMAECLQLIANAAGCAIYFQRDGRLRIAPLNDTANSEDVLVINGDNSYAPAEVGLTKPIKQVDVSVYSYMEAEKEKDLYKEALSLQSGDNTFLIEYSDILSGDLSVSLSNSLAGIVQVESYAQCCRLVLHADSPCSCTVTLKGDTVKTTESTYTAYNASAGEVQSLKNSLITNRSQAATMAQYVLTYAKRRKQVAADWRIDPRLDVGDVVKVGDSDVLVTGSSLSFSGAFKGKNEGVMIE